MEQQKITCCFTGHRPSKLPWGDDERDPRCMALKQDLMKKAESAYLKGYRHFICGMALGCDLYFCETVLELREKYPDIRVEAAVPCAAQADGWSAENRARYKALLDRCDWETLVQHHYDPGCMLRRNRYMVDHSALIIAVYNGTPGGTQNTLAYAMRAGLETEILDLDHYE